MKETVRLRRDLAGENLSVPAWKSWKGWENHTALERNGTLIYLDAKGLDGATQEPDLYQNIDGHPSHELNRIRLTNGKVYFILGVDLDWPLPNGKYDESYYNKMGLRTMSYYVAHCRDSDDENLKKEQL